ncbi:MAG: S8 family serine peptidase [Pirellulaceae bacterium]|nr:S8 family serine peptidase [Pirellulaceae bacterium]
MSREKTSLIPRREWKFESVEDRLAMSAHPLARGFELPGDDAIAELATSLAQSTSSGRNWTDVSTARRDFGLSGSGQTVAVIDSGIAYDHVALGGGLGAAYRVVGGWDFAENDANPYDDGPAGYHGTHVAGIVGAADPRYAGVAPGADLVGLRVFDDQGNSSFEWVNSALQWVHQHRHDFENPITTVNLSLGIDWNSTNLPKWATLEASLKQLADDGIFISVAAGNSFLTYGTTGLSYPAVSPWVTPVSSVDASGNLSRFSQRSDRVLAAPGEKVMSTLPDAFYGGDGVKNDWGAASGTSMAAPYVAGASVLLREAMQDLGYTQITEEQLYQRLYASADLVYDTATRASYHRVNLTNALTSLVGTDDFGGSITDATAAGTLTSQLNISGTIGRVSDKDFFRFTAAQTGTATLTLASTTELAAAWQTTGGTGQISGNTLTLSVVAGQSYVVGVAGGGAHIGKFSVAMSLAATETPSTPTAINWGNVEQSQREGVNLQTGDNWFQISATRTGTFTVESFFAQARGIVDLEIYDAQRRLIGSSSGTGDSERIDFSATAGSTYFVRARGANSDVDFRLTNLVSTSGTTIDVAGTAAGDTMRWSAANRQLVVNGVSYVFAGATNIRVHAGTGTDSITLVGSSAAETVTLRPGTVELVGGGISFAALNVESARVSGSLNDTAVLYDSAGLDNLEASLTSVSLSGSGFRSTVDGFGKVTIYATAGTRDMATLVGSAGSDTLLVSGGVRQLTGGGVTIRTENFQAVQFQAGGGSDAINFSSTAKQSSLGGRGSGGWISTLGYTTEFAEVESVLASIRLGDRLSTDLTALDYLFRRIGVR